MLNLQAFNLPYYNQGANQLSQNYATNPGQLSIISITPDGVSSQQGLFGNFNQLNNASNTMPQAQQMNNPMQMFMQFFQMMMQMFSQLMGMQPNQYQQPQQQQAQNAMPFSQGLPLQQPLNYTKPYQTQNYNQPQSTQPQYNQQTQNNQTAQPKNDLLNKVDQKELDAVKGENLNAVDSNGYPKYLVHKANDGQYHLYKQKKEGDGKNYKSVTKVKNGSNNLYVKDPEKNKQAAASAASAAASGNGSSAASASASYTNMSLGFDINGDNRPDIFMDYTNSSSASSAASSGASGAGSSGSNSSPIENEGGGSTGSPLILDTNKDGKVSAEHGKGVDVNGDGKVDGAATGGDKMLAMGDLDGDGQITGKEVFGNETVDPFTGQKLNAKNGFDALAQVAKSAEKNTGIKCVDENGQVDVQKLKHALEMSGKGSLGMISGDNNKTLEGLGDVSKINTSNYINQQQTGNVQHNQLGSYTDTSGNQQKINDVWFAL
ncbi:MAG: hypothetical protein AB1782_01055 [Cyanobacteriota bacterium]